MKVPHNFKYHAEIRYEGEIAMAYTCAAGNTLEQLMWDIDHELERYADRDPEVEEVLYDANGSCEDITSYVKNLMNKRRKQDALSVSK